MGEQLPEFVITMPERLDRDCIIHEYLNESGLFKKMDALKQENKELRSENSKFSREVSNIKSKMSQLEVREYDKISSIYV